MAYDLALEEGKCRENFENTNCSCRLLSISSKIQCMSMSFKNIGIPLHV